jgi:nitrate/TMAO reductase-like tetraheme cytochrome c subunit
LEKKRQEVRKFSSEASFVSAIGNFKNNWLQPFFFLGKNTLSLVGGAMTTASAFVMIGFWMVDVFGHGGSSNPYIGLILFLFLPGFFILGLILIPIGIAIQRRRLLMKGTLPSIYPAVDFNDPMFRHALNFVILATFVNFVIVGIASYRGVAYMDTPGFCGTSCHVPMQPQWVAYQHSPHSHVDCTECHVGGGAANYIHAKMAGMKQLAGVTFNTFPRPIIAPLSELRPASATCEACHAPNRFIGDRLLVKTTFGDDEKNAMTKTMLVLHLGGVDSLSRLSGIHGHHLNQFQYTATDSGNQTIISIDAPGPNGTITEYVSSDWKGPIKGVRRTMDCMDCHNQAAHLHQTAEDAVDESMTNGMPDPSLPFVHKQGLLLIQGKYASQMEAAAKIKSGLEDFYRTQYPAVWNSQHSQIDQAATILITIYEQNVFPAMKVAWGTYPNNIGHNNFPGCFRCHDGNHTSKDGKTITNDCSVCHNLLAVDEPNPKLLRELSLQ